MTERASKDRRLAWALSILLGATGARAQPPLDAPSEAATRSEAAETPGAAANCVEQHEQAQIDRLSGRLRSAKDRLLACSSRDCPDVVRSDCLRWYPELTSSIPSLVVSVRRGNQDVVGARLDIDGVQLLEPLDGREIELDPGTHELRLFVGSEPPLLRTILVSKGDRARHLLFELPERARPRAAPSARPPDKPEFLRPIPTWTYVAGGVALAGFATAAILGGVGLSERNSLATSCAPFCSDAQTSGVDGLLTAADVALTVGLVSTAATVVTYLMRPSVAVRPSAGAFAGGAYLGAAGSF